MSEYIKYPRDLWEYIKDLSYMPSRADREKFLIDETKRERIKLWDYFFRFKPEDVGKPQRKEISFLIREIRESVEKCKQREEDVLNKIKEYERRAFVKAITKFFWGSIVLGIALFLSNRISTETISAHDKYVYGVVFFFSWLIILIIFVGLSFFLGEEKKESRWLVLDLKEFKDAHFKKVDEDKYRIKALKREITRLRRQVPKPLSGAEARNWLDREFKKLWAHTKSEVALVRDIIKIQGERPDVEIEYLSVLGPGELQQKTPMHYSESVNEDLHKHLGAKQAYRLDPDKHGIMYDILYGVYFIEYIIVATDMLVTHSFFYDFIDDKMTAAYTTEQYYTDVVALAIENEDRRITLENAIGEVVSVYIEDSPTFTLSLKSGEIHKVSFVNQDYFIKIREKLNMTLDDIDKIYWINQARRIADNVIKALRHYIRQHKHE